MKESKQPADKLTALLQALKDEENVPQQSELDDADVVLMTNLVSMSKSIRPDATFTKELRGHLLERVDNRGVTERLAVHETLSQKVVTTLTAWKSAVFKQRRLSYVLGVTMVLFLVVSMAMPALAQFALEHVLPREVVAFPVPDEIILETAPPERSASDIATVEELAGFSALLPAHLPADCEFSRADYLEEPVDEIHLHYRSSKDSFACLTVHLRQVRDNKLDRPAVHEGSVGELMVHGKPAIYINGTWLLEGELGGTNGSTFRTRADKLFENARWVEGPQQLFFEQDRLVVRLFVESTISKEELIKIAESMQ